MQAYYFAEHRQLQFLIIFTPNQKKNQYR